MKTLAALLLGLLLVGCVSVNVKGPAPWNNDYYKHAYQAATLISDMYGHGSGVIIGRNRVLTAGHLQVGSRKLPTQVHFRDGDGTIVIGVFEQKNESMQSPSNLDYALLEVEVPAKYSPALIRCERPVLGEPVFIVGNPLDERWIMVTGRVAAEDEFVPFANRILIHLDGRPGMSGSGVYSLLDGKLIGVLTEARRDLNLTLVVPVDVIGEAENALCA